MTLMDQAADRSAEPVTPTVLVYRKTDRGIVYKALEQTTDFTPPAGWSETPYELGWHESLPLLAAIASDEPTASRSSTKSKKVVNHDDST